MKRVRIYPPCPECMDPELKKGGQWIQKATASIKRRGTEGKCTGSNYGGPGCPPGSKQYNLAKTFRKMARGRKKEFGGEADQNVNTAEYGAALLGNFRDHLAANAINAFTENTLLDIVRNPVVFQYGGNPASGYGYNPAVYNIDPYIQQQQDLANNFGNSMWDLITGADTAFRTPNSFKAKTKFNRENPYFKQYKKTYREQEKDAMELAKNPWMQYLPQQEFGGTLPKAQVGLNVVTNMMDSRFNPALRTKDLTKGYQEAVEQLKSNKPLSREEAEAWRNWMQIYFQVENSINPYQEYPYPVQYNPNVHETKTTPTTTATSNKTTTTSNKTTTPKGSGISTGQRTVLTDEDLGVPTTGTSAAEKVEASRRGNVFDEEETQTTTTGVAPASSPAGNYGYNPYNPYYNPFVVYPQMGMFGQRTGRMPIAFDMSNTTPVIETRRALLHGNRIKSIRFEHYAPSGSKPIEATKPATTATTTTGGNESWRTPQLRYPQNQTPRAETPEEQKWFDEQERMMRENPRAFGMMKRLYGGDLPVYQGGWTGNIPGRQDQFVQPVQTFMDNLQNAGVFDPSQVGQSWPLWMKKPKGTNSGRADAENIQEWNDSIKDDTPWASTVLKKASPFARTMIGPALSAATSIGRQLTAPQYNLEDLTAAERVFTPKRRGDMGEIPFNFAGNYMDVAGYTPVQNKGYTAKKGGSVRKFQQGGTYNLTEEEIQDLLASGAEIEFID